MNSLRTLAVVVVAALLTASCAARDGDEIGGAPIFNGTTPDGQVVEPPVTTLPTPEIDAIRVPIDSFSIQEAVDIAQPGDLILIEPGVYFEQVVVNTPDIVIRGRNRNTVFVDGNHASATGFTIRANGVAIENMTVRNYTANSINVSGDEGGVPRNGFRAFHVTTSNSDGSGIFLQNATNVEIRQGWFSGHGDAGVSVTDCTQCNTLITTSLAEFSARGYSIRGADQGVSVFSATSRNNRAGVVVEDTADRISSGVVVAGSLIQNNGFTQSPNNVDLWDTLFGVGVNIGGTVDSSVIANRIEGNLRAGVLLAPAIDGSSGDPIATRVEGNATTAHPEGDVVVAFSNGVVDPVLCIVNNAEAVVQPDGAVEAATCSAESAAPPTLVWTGEPRTSIPHQNAPVPQEINGMTDADSAIPIPAGPVTTPDPSTAVIPDA